MPLREVDDHQEKKGSTPVGIRGACHLKEWHQVKALPLGVPGGRTQRFDLIANQQPKPPAEVAFSLRSQPMRLSELHAMNASLQAFNAGIASHFTRHHHAPTKPAAMKRVPPPNTNDCPEYLHDCDLGELMCWFEYEPAEPSTDSQTVWNLTHAWLGDINVAPCLPDWAVKEIERDAWTDFKEQQLQGEEPW